MDIKRLEQIVIEEKYSKYNLFNKLHEALDNNLLADILSIVRDEELATATASVILTIQGTELLTIVASKLANKIDKPRIEAVCDASTILAEIARNTDYLVFSLRNKHIIVKSNIKLTERVEEILIESECLPPMLVKPKKVKHNFHSGYISINKPLLLTKHKVHNKKQNLVFINMMNQVSLSINEYVLQIEEEPKHSFNTKKEEQAFKYHIKASNKAYEHILNNGNQCYVVHNYDTRGRFYVDNWQFNYQGTDYKKALTCLAKQEIITC